MGTIIMPIASNYRVDIFKNKYIYIWGDIAGN